MYNWIRVFLMAAKLRYSDRKCHIKWHLSNKWNFRGWESHKNCLSFRPLNLGMGPNMALTNLDRATPRNLCPPGVSRAMALSPRQCGLGRPAYYASSPNSLGRRLVRAATEVRSGRGPARGWQGPRWHPERKLYTTDFNFSQTSTMVRNSTTVRACFNYI